MGVCASMRLCIGLLLFGAPPSLYIGGWVSGTVSEEDYMFRKGTEGFLIYLLVLVESVMCWTSICLRNRHGFLGFMGFDMPFFGISMLG